MGGYSFDTAVTQVLMAVLAGVIAWALLVRLAAGLTRLPGLLGVVGRLAWRGLVPPALRLGVAGLLGVQTLMALPAQAGGGDGTAGVPPSAEAAVVVGRPLTGLAEPAASAPDAPASPAPAPVAAAVVVAPGDSLWRIAERHLPGDPTDADVAREWPRWFAANGTRIGPDPNLLRIGTVLVPPAPEVGP
jgi:nucleoid-associated protein YgaU